MSGGYFNYMCPDYLDGEWRDEELDEMVHDLFFGGDFSIRGYGGLLQTLDFWLSSDTSEETYREQVDGFKAKWFRRTPKNRVEFYQRKIQDYADKCKREFGGKVENDGNE